MTKLAVLYLLLGIHMSPAIVATYPVSSYGTQYAQLVILSQQLCNGAYLTFADSSDSSSSSYGYRPSHCMFQRQSSQGLNKVPKIPRRQTNMLAMKAPNVPASSTMKPSVRIDLVGTTSPFTFLKIHSPGHWPRPSSIPAAFTRGPDSHIQGSEYPVITTKESPLDTTAPAGATSYTTKEPRGDA